MRGGRAVDSLRMMPRVACHVANRVIGRELASSWPYAALCLPPRLATAELAADSRQQPASAALRLTSPTTITIRSPADRDRRFGRSRPVNNGAIDYDTFQRRQ